MNKEAEGKVGARLTGAKISSLITEPIGWMELMGFNSAELGRAHSEGRVKASKISGDWHSILECLSHG